MNSSYRHPQRTGILLVDAACGLALLAVAGALLVNLLSSLAHVRRATEVRQAANQCVANLMERQASQPWDGLQLGRRELPLSEEQKKTFPGATAWVEVSESHPLETSGLRQILVELRWPESNNSPRPVRLFTWLGKPGRAQP